MKFTERTKKNLIGSLKLLLIILTFLLFIWIEILLYDLVNAIISFGILSITVN